ncbi:MAG: AI-2E family transporter [Lachnospiraceae bacterium]|nr:AI-2E family transporter [Lachnospiraceae bacterium]
MQQNKEQRKKRWQYIMTRFMILALTILFFFFLYRFKDLCNGVRRVLSILGPFIYGGVMAYLLRIPCNFFEKHLKKWLPERRQKVATGFAILISMFMVLMIFYLLVRLVAPQLVISISSIVAALPGAVSNASQWLQTKLEKDPVMKNYIQTAMDVVYPKFMEWSQSDLLPMLQNMAGGFASTVSSVLGVFMNLLIGVVVCIYTLGARKKFAKQGKAVLYSIFKPKWADYILDEVKFADKMFVGFFGGKILDSAIIGIICYVCCLIFRFPNAMLISVIVGVTNIIPYFGPWIGAIPSVILILIVDPMKCIWFILFIAILQGFDGNILGPKLLGDSTGLSSFWVLFAITVFSGLLGFSGFLIGVPLFAVIYDLIHKLVVLGLKRHNKLDILENPEADSSGSDSEAEESKKAKNSEGESPNEAEDSETAETESQPDIERESSKAEASTEE